VLAAQATPLEKLKMNTWTVFVQGTYVIHTNNKPHVNYCIREILRKLLKEE